MSYTSDELFVKEFKEMIKQRKANYANDKRFYLTNLKIPKAKELGLTEPKKSQNTVYIKDITEPFYKELNGLTVKIFTGDCQRKLYDKGGRPYKDSTGAYMYQKVRVPQDCIAILTDKNIKLRKKYEEGGEKRDYQEKKEYQYVDYAIKGKQVRYVYIIPKEKVYKLNYKCLMLSMTPRRQYYGGYKIYLQTGMLMYLYIAPFNKRYLNNEQDTNLRIVGIGAVGTNKALKTSLLTILKLLRQQNIVFDWEKTQLQYGVHDIKNCSLTELKATLDGALYEQVGESLIKPEVEEDEDTEE